MEIYQTKDLYLTDKKPKKYVRSFELVTGFLVKRIKDNYIINYMLEMSKYEFQEYINNFKQENIVIYTVKINSRFKMFTKEPNNHIFYIFVLRWVLGKL